MSGIDDVRDNVLKFYQNLQFNVNEKPGTTADLIRKTNNVEYIYPNPKDFYDAKTVLEIGCGCGWLSNSIAYYYGPNVTAIDLNPSAIEHARETANLLQIDVDFNCADLFGYECEQKDIVLSVGVLHHTSDVRGVLKCVDLLKCKGKIFIGLYHKFGRKPFLDYFQMLKRESSDEDFLLKKYLELDRRHVDKIQAKSWFYDQVLHPYETQHTLREIMEIFQEANITLISTSINAYQKINDIEELYRKEEELYQIGTKYLDEKKYYPGFFYVLGQKK